MTTSPASPGGRELDALVAEKVMGFTWLTEWQGRAGAWLVTADGEYLAGWRRNDGGVTAHLDGIARNADLMLPPYSTDIAAAWLVVAKLMERAFDVHLVVSHESGCCCTVRLGLTDSQEFTVTDCDTLPLAICRAALLVVESRS